jgi:hypothetical protein
MLRVSLCKKLFPASSEVHCHHVCPTASACAAVLLQVSPTESRLHLQLAQPGVTTPERRHGPSCSPAGQGPGLQVFPGSTPEVDCVSTGAAGYVNRWQLAV